MASLLRQQMLREIRRIDGSARDAAIRRAVGARREQGAAPVSTPANPLPWWSRATAAEHSAWLAAEVPPAVPYAELDAHRLWTAGQPVLLSTDGHEHTFYVRLESIHFGPRWLKPGPQWRVHPAALSPRNPRALWSDAWELELALALEVAEHDPRLAWLRDLDPVEEPDLCALRELALQELRPAPYFTTAGRAPSPQPQPIRAWTVAELEALRMPEGTIEPVDLAPGRQSA